MASIGERPERFEPANDREEHAEQDVFGEVLADDCG